MASDDDIRAAYRDVFGLEITDDWLATQRPVPLDRAGFTQAYQGWEDADIRAAYRDVFGQEITDDWLATQRPSNLGRAGFTQAYQGWEDAQNKNQYSIREFTTGAGGDAGYNTEYALVDPKGNRVAGVAANKDDYGNIIDYFIDSGGEGYSNIVPVNLDAINARAAKGTVPFGTGMGPALGYAYGMKNSSGDIFRKFDAKGNLTEFLDEHGKFQPASSFQPTGMQFNASTGNFETTYKSPNSPRENITESSAATVNRYSPTSGGWLGAGGWGNIARLVVAGLTANPALMASIGISSSVASAIGNVAIGIADGKNFGEALLDGVKSGAISAATSGILQGINADGVDNIAANWEDAVNNGSFVDAAVNFSDNYIAPVIDSGGTFTGDAGITDSDMSFADLLDAVGISSDQGAAGLDTATEIGTKVGDIATTGGDQVTQTDTNTTGNTVADVIADTGTNVEDAITGTTTGNVEDVIADTTTGTTDTVGTADTTTGSPTDTTGTNTTTGDTGTTIEDVIENTDETTEAQADEVDPIATPLIQQLRADVERYEAAGMERDEALNQAITDLATQTGQNTQEIIAQIAAGDAALYEQFQGFQQDVANSIENLASELGLTKQEILDKLAAGDQAVMDALGVTEQNLTDYITSIQQDLGGQITDLGTDLGGQITTVRDELTGEIIGVRDDLTGQITDLGTDLGGQITDVGGQVTDLTTDFGDYRTEQEEKEKRKRGKEALDYFTQSATTTVKTPEVAKIDYMYDIGGDSLFATPKQESLMPSPYEDNPEPVEGAMPRYQYYAPGGGYTYAQGGLIGSDDLQTIEDLYRILGSK
jgi:hypothetical protein